MFEKAERALYRSLFVISTKALILAFARKQEGEVEKSVLNRFLDSASLHSE